MAPKRKFALSQNPLRFGASSSSSDPTTLLFGSMMNKPERTSWRTFLDKAFIQNAKSFCWTSLTLTYPLSVHVDLGVLLQHAKIWLLNTFFVTCIRSTCIVVTPNIVSDALHVLKVEHLDYPHCERLRTVSKEELISAFCERPFDWGDCQFTLCSAFAKGP